MNCLVLGGGGFLGSHLTDALAGAGYRVRVFERFVPGPGDHHPAAAVEWLQGDFNDSEDLRRAVAGCDVIYHMVSSTVPKTSNEDPAYDIQTNLISTLQMLELARKAGAKKLIFISSGGTVYGVPREVPIKETHPTEPVCSYAIGKLAVEKYLHLYKVLHGMDYCILRLANPYGERQKPTGAQGAVAVFLHRAVRGEAIEIWGDGSVVRDYIYVGDAVQAMLAAMRDTGEHRLFNIGAGEGHSLNQLVAAIEKLLGHPVECRYTPGRTFDVPVNVLDITRAREVMGWAPKVSFEQGLRRTWQWLAAK